MVKMVQRLKGQALYVDGNRKEIVKWQHVPLSRNLRDTNDRDTHKENINHTYFPHSLYSCS